MTKDFILEKGKTPPFYVVLLQQFHGRRPKNTLWLLYQITSWLRRIRGFFVRSAETVPCPCCGEPLVEVVGSRARVWYQSSGERLKLIIRRLRCKVDRRIHHELPDILVPYKRYDAESIERVITVPVQVDVAVDNSTIYRWNDWFHSWVDYAIGCLQSISFRFHFPVEEKSIPSQSVLLPLGRYIDMAVGWLSRVVRPIANSNLWVTDPFRISVQTALK
ncbi:DUF6431 domain-containing protein [Bacillus carboniphilus]|uniref:DUF6431 domain-containing protein n=1 Tax=Bacillus carboniphilus TaxID=86663 RepID=UPI0031D630A9